MRTLLISSLIMWVKGESRTFDEKFRSICHGVREPSSQDASWSEEFYKIQSERVAKEDRTSMHLQYDLLRLAQSLYFPEIEFSKLKKNKVADFWDTGREHYELSGGTLKSRVNSNHYKGGGCQGSRDPWYYLGINKNGISTFSYFFRDEVGFQNVDRSKLWLDWRLKKSLQTFVFIRDPQSRFISAFLEVILKHTYLIAKLPVKYHLLGGGAEKLSQNDKGIHNFALQETKNITTSVNLRSSASPYHFRGLADLFLRSEPGCNPETNTAWCKNHVHKPNPNAAHNPSRAWHHLAPQMWFLDYWFPSESFLYAQPADFLIDLSNSSNFAKDQFSNMCGPSSKKKQPNSLNKRNVKTSPLLLSAKKQLQQSPRLQQAVCALYARDYLCLGYALPSVCKPIQHRISRVLFHGTVN